MEIEPRILNSVMTTNAERRPMVVKRVEELVGELKGKTVGLFGLAFKPNTDDMRDAPSVDIAASLTQLGATVVAFDPVAMDVAQPLMPNVTMKSSAYEVAQDADAVVVVTEWNEFKHIDLERLKTSMRAPVVVDARNIYNPAKMGELGFTYRSIGRGANGKRN
jgi:UDPglucose 6-dehydrogenase